MQNTARKQPFAIGIHERFIENLVRIAIEIREHIRIFGIWTVATRSSAIDCRFTGIQNAVQTRIDLRFFLFTGADRQDGEPKEDVEKFYHVVPVTLRIYLILGKKINRLDRTDTYRTLAVLSEGLYKEKGSKFIAYAAPCFNEQQAKELLNDWKKQHHQARHLCYAYRFGIQKDIYRANDDGEPSNSAGAPILGQIQSFELTNVLIGVVRYFGGTKLGVGGLIHAYRTAAKEAVLAGKLVDRKVFEHVQLHFGYLEMPEVMSLVKHHQLAISGQDFQESCTLEIALPLDMAEAIKASLLKQNELKLESLGIY